MSASSQPVAIEFPPGARKKRKRFTAKGRQVDEQAIADVQSLLGERPRRRDHLIEFRTSSKTRMGTYPRRTSRHSLTR